MTERRDKRFSMPIVNPSETKRILNKHNIHLTKRLGQHYLIDGNVLAKEIDAADLTKQNNVVEVGPGIGTLTEALAARAGRVIAVEFDSRIPPILRDTLAAFDNVEVVEQDAMTVDYGRLGVDSLVSNLPYNIGTALIAKVLIEAPNIRRLTVMIQKEVAARLVAAPGAKDYGVLAITVGCFAAARMVADVKRTSFLPPPDVDSSIVTIDRLAEPLFGKETAAFLAFVKTVFGMRRKTLGAVLARSGHEAAAISRALSESGVPAQARAETLSARQLYRIYAGLSPQKS
jgi:16S rRNA (adenine1518-N6/adenine1519-N6)-dimethyltransferase